MKSCFSIMLFFIVQVILASCVSPSYDLFYLTLEWPQSRWETIKGCCHPVTGPLTDDFIVHELRPGTNRGNKNPTFCDPNNKFDLDKISDIRKRLETDWPSLDCPSSNSVSTWLAKWEEQGTCSILNQHEYFEAALNLKNKLNLLKILKDGGIEPSRKYFTLKNIKSVIKEAVGSTPHLICVYDRRKNRQLHKVRFCIDISGTSFIECPKWLKLVTCKDRMRLPPFNIPYGQ